MKIRCGYSLSYEFAAPTPVLFLLSVRPEREGDLLEPERLSFDPPLAARQHLDSFGNRMTRVLAPPGLTTVSADFLVADGGLADEVAPDAVQHPVDDLPDEVLPFLLPSRYCETEHLMDTAWAEFGPVQPGWKRVQAIVDYTHARLKFGYPHARATRTALEAHEERLGVCRDFAHLAIALCRCLNIPARYATGYLGDIGVEPIDAAMDFSAWFEVYLGGRWRTFDARHNRPRIGRIVMAYGRDATDVAISTAFGSARLIRFEVTTAEEG